MKALGLAAAILSATVPAFAQHERQTQFIPLSEIPADAGAIPIEVDGRTYEFSLSIAPNRDAAVVVKGPRGARHWLADRFQAVDLGAFRFIIGPREPSAPKAVSVDLKTKDRAPFFHDDAIYLFAPGAQAPFGSIPTSAFLEALYERSIAVGPEEPGFRMIRGRTPDDRYATVLVLRKTSEGAVAIKVLVLDAIREAGDPLVVDNDGRWLRARYVAERGGIALYRSSRPAKLRELPSDRLEREIPALLRR